MICYEAPAKLNLSLLVHPPRPDGYHPLESLVQTIEWCDNLRMDRGEGDDSLDSEIEDDLVLRAVGALRRRVALPPLDMRLAKEIPMEAGLGGGSSDAAAALRAASGFNAATEEDVLGAAAEVGADVPLFLTGGTQVMTGVGETLSPEPPLEGFALAVVVPVFGLSTADVYRRWDEMGGPTGETIADDSLPPPLRGGMPARNDLLPAALDIEPRLGDFMADLRSVWGAPALLTGSGSACFGYFASLDEASSASSAVSGSASVCRGVSLRPYGVRGIDPDGCA